MKNRVRSHVWGLIGLVLVVACVLAPIAAVAETPQDYNTNVSLGGVNPILTGWIYCSTQPNSP